MDAQHNDTPRTCLVKYRVLHKDKDSNQCTTYIEADRIWVADGSLSFFRGDERVAYIGNALTLSIEAN